MKNAHFRSLSFAAALFAFASCGSEKNADFDYYYYEPKDYALLSESLNLPDIPYDYTQIPLNSSATARFINRDWATLGRVLFYDKKLSKDGKVACAHCHKQEIAFGDDKAVSLGVFDRVGDRNSIALLSVTSFADQYGTDLNGIQGKRFFWDNRAATAPEQSKGSMTNPKEMDMTLEEIANIVAATPYYKPLWVKAFGDQNVDGDRVTQAIGTFVNALGSTNSPFDKALSAATQGGHFDIINAALPLLNTAENRGKNIYMANCSGCHSTDLNTIHVSNTSNGLDLNPQDPGVGGVTKLEKDMGTFKIPLLRNIALSAPYMHDGRFQTLEQVVDFYSNGIQAHPNLDPLLRNPDGTPRHFQFTEQEKQDLLAFLHTFTDTKVIYDVRFSDPYK